MTSPTPDAVLRLGTRGSALALAQSTLVARAVERALGVRVELVRVRTEGDRLTGSLAALGGAGVFVAALREAVADGRCDLAVHSLKDLPTADAPGLVVAAIPERADPRDALCARDGLTVASLPPGARVGTGSPRRAAQLRAVRPDLEVVDIRGNVDTRLGRVPGLGAPDAPGDLDAVVLAAAGLARLGRSAAASDLLDPTVVSPAPGQGALAIECRADDTALVEGLAALDHLPSRLAVTAERALLAALEAGCAAPVGALGELRADGVLVLDAVVCRPDGGARIARSAAVPVAGLVAGLVGHDVVATAAALGARLAADLLAAGAADLAPLGPAAATAAATSATPAGALTGWRVLVPRSGEWGDRMRTRLAEHGATAVVVPVIEFAPPADLPSVDAAVGRLARGEYDWLTVTSATTVLALAGRAAAVVGGPASEALSAVVGRTAVAAVGPGTARALERHGVVPTLMPDEYSAQGLLTSLTGRAAPGRALVPQSDRAELTLADGLRAAGWEVDVVLAYRTVPAERPPASVAGELRAGQFDAVLLSSTSTVAGLLELVGTPPRSTVVACIGPRTAAAAAAAGLTVAVVPDVASGEALVDALAAHAGGARTDARPTRVVPATPAEPEEGL